MRVPDANLLIYAYNADSKEHLRALRWFQSCLSSPEPVGIPLQSISAFLRITTHRKLLARPLTTHQAVSIVQAWLALPHVHLLLPGKNHWVILQRLLVEGQVSGDLVTDAQIAAVALEYGGVVETNDRHFARFPGLRWHNPLDGDV